MGILDSAGLLTWNGQQAIDYLLKPIYQSPELSTVFRVRSGVISKTQLNLVGIAEKVLKKRTTCGQTTTGTIALTGRELAVERLYMHITECADDFDDTFLEELRNKGYNIDDLSNTEIINGIIVPVLTRGIISDSFRIATLGDTGSADADYNQLDGMWKLVEDAVTATDISKVDITENVGPTALAAGAAEGYLRSVYEEADDLLKQVDPQQKVFMVTGSVYDNYLTTMEDKGVSEAFNLEVNGISGLKFRGVPVIPVRAWDRFIAADLTNTNPHRILYTTTNNPVSGNWFLGTDESDRDLGVRAWFDRDEEVNRVKASFKMGVQYAFPELIKPAY